jgi:hypothetical protein
MLPWIERRIDGRKHTVYRTTAAALAVEVAAVEVVGDEVVAPTAQDPPVEDVDTG